MVLFSDRLYWVQRGEVGNVDADAETEWAAEIERRLAQIEAGQAKSVSMNESLARLQRIARG